MIPVSSSSSAKRAFEEKHALQSPLPGNWSQVRLSVVEALALKLIDTMRADAILAEDQANGLGFFSGYAQHAPPSALSKRPFF